MSTQETFCTACQRVTYVPVDARLECPVCSSPLLSTVEGEREDELPAATAEDTEDLSQAAG